MVLPHDAFGLSAVCDCRISWSYSHTIFGLHCVIVAFSGQTQLLLDETELPFSIFVFSLSF